MMMASGLDDEFLEADHVSEDDPFLEEERPVLKDEKRNLGLSENYVPTWGTQEAFREFYQNW